MIEIRKPILILLLHRYGSIFELTTTCAFQALAACTKGVNIHCCQSQVNSAASKPCYHVTIAGVFTL